MSIQSEIIDALEELEGDCDDQTFTWKTAELPFVPDSLERGTEVQVGGQVWTVDFAIRVRKSHFISADASLPTADSDEWTADSSLPHPIAGRLLTIRGKEFKILTVSESPCRAYVKLALGDKHSGK